MVHRLKHKGAEINVQVRWATSYFENNESTTFAGHVCKYRNTGTRGVGLKFSKRRLQQIEKKKLKKYSAEGLSDAAILKMYCCALEMDDITLKSYCKKYPISVQAGEK